MFHYFKIFNIQSEWVINKLMDREVDLTMVLHSSLCASVLVGKLHVFELHSHTLTLTFKEIISRPY